MIESIVVAVFCIAMVFFVLATLYALLIIMSKVLGNHMGKAYVKTDLSVQVNEEDWDADPVMASSGELRLINVDEKTAAMIMAIVSDETHIPLSELQFKSIKAVD